MASWKPQPFERKSLFAKWPDGLDSIQGYLELADWYDSSRVSFVCDPRDATEYHSMYFYLSQLEKDGHLVIDWHPYMSDGRQLRQIKQLALSVSGRKLLTELRAKSRWGRLTERLLTIVWAALTALVTTLVVLAVKGV